ncbi:MAG: non-heme iron oxygenase ferredoxin subunit [Acidimicrobiia bacterium]|nr:non-heme iron oxygenase ferredoxin subunit [Acidimicrobiia bacterium]MDH5289180.1 non-heme iron oxygenase ferredoxin subunit [Acidimicrobiia bacterium]
MSVSGTTVTVCRLEDLKPRSARRFDVAGHRLAVIRFDDDVYVIGDRCSHADYSLAEGEIDSDEGTIECWKHGSTFSVTTGEATCLPATKPVPVYEVSVVDGEVRVVLP